MNSIVCNSRPIIALSSIDCFTLLPQLFEKIYIPEAVLQEVTFGRKKQVALQLDNNVFERYQFLRIANEF